MAEQGKLKADIVKKAINKYKFQSNSDHPWNSQTYD